MDAFGDSKALPFAEVAADRLHSSRGAMGLTRRVPIKPGVPGLCLRKLFMTSPRPATHKTTASNPALRQHSAPAAHKPHVAEPLEVWARRELQKLERETLEALRTLAEQEVVERASPDQLDAAAEQEQREATVRMGARLKDRLQDIHKAQRKLDDDEYGLCEISGEEISEARLRANPLARYTLEVQERMELRQRQGLGA
jgi:DnaK suppressor protein